MKVHLFRISSGIAMAAFICSLTTDVNTNEIANEIHVTGILSKPFLMQSLDSLNNSGNEEYDGFCKDFLENLFEKLGLKYRLHLSKDGTYGRKNNTTGTWSGMIGELVSKTTDMIVADLSVTSERAEAIDFSVSFMDLELAILMKHPNTIAEEEDTEVEPGKIFPWFKPMTFWVWLTFTLALLILLFIIFFTEKIISIKIIKGIQPVEDIFTGFSSRVFGTPKSNATRILQVTFWIFVLICFCTYTSNFAADNILGLVRNPKAEYPLKIASAETLAAQDKIKFGILKSGSTFSYFQKSKNPIISKLNTKIFSSGGYVESYTQGIFNVRNSNVSDQFAFIMESPIAIYTTTKKPCDLVVVPEFFGPKMGFSVGISKESKKLDLKTINLAILELKEGEFMNNLFEKWFKDSTQCDKGEKTEFKMNKDYNHFTLESMASLFILLTIAIFLVFIIAGIETVIYRKNERLV